MPTKLCISSWFVGWVDDTQAGPQLLHVWQFDCQDGKTIDIVSRIPAHRTCIFGWPTRPLCARCTRSSNFVPLLKSNANLLLCAAWHVSLPKCRFLYLMKGFTGHATELLVSRVKSNQRQMRNAISFPLSRYLPELMDMGNPLRGNSCRTGGFGIAMDLFPSRRCWDLWPLWAPKAVHLSSEIHLPSKVTEVHLNWNGLVLMILMILMKLMILMLSSLEVTYDIKLLDLYL